MLGFYDIGFGFVGGPKPVTQSRKGRTTTSVKTKAETGQAVKAETKVETKTTTVSEENTKAAESQPQIDKKYWNF